ncbi:MAG TPA: LysE family transporter [Anaerolineaceae bacterium]|nr:LysE family transporter [Anaerolineaceae bacterium]
MLVYLSLGMSLGFAATVQPGPFLTYVISQTLKCGWRRTLPMAFAPIISDGPVAALILIFLVNLPKWMEPALRIAGGLFLLYLSYGAYRSWRSYDLLKISQAQATQQSVWKAVTVNLLNPGPYLGWSLVLGPLLLKGWREDPRNGLALLAGFYGTMVASLVVIILLFSATTNLGPRVNRTLIGLTAIALAIFGGYQLWMGFGR